MMKQLHTRPTPAPGEPRPCVTKGCGSLFTPGKGGWGDHCGRCQAAISAGRTPGPRIRQPRGKAKVPVRAFVHPDLLQLLTAERLAQYGVRTPAEFLVLAGARLLGREEFAPKPKPKKPTTKSEPTR